MAKAGKKPSRRQLREHCFKLLFCVGFHPAGDMQAQMERYFQGIPEEESDGLDSAPPEDRDGFKAWESTMPAAPVGRKGRRGGKGGALPGAGRSFGGEVSQGGAEALPGAGRSFGGEVSQGGAEALTGAGRSFGGEVSRSGE
ncbi:MAG: hypothetical protein LBR77_08055, partial [Lachnospiraceae bacterium]|nr:hypothetical protein [Lachnospiraceae bacterium]